MASTVDPSVETLPTCNELEAMTDDLARAIEPVDLISGLLARMNQRDVALARDMTAADAWEITMFARDVRLAASHLAREADALEKRVEEYMLGGTRPHA